MSMTRRSGIFGFLLGLAAPLLGQKADESHGGPQGLGHAQWKQCIVKPGGIGEEFSQPWGCTDGLGMKKPLNNQCPVCGTMAQPYHPDIRYCGDYNIGQQPTALGMAGCEPKSIMCRCLRCNASFWQDEEPAK